MITAIGKENLLNAIAGTKKGWATTIMVGIGDTATTVDDTYLEFPISGGDISTVIVDPINNKIYFKATLNVQDEYEIREMACYPGNIIGLQQSGDNGGSTITIFGSQQNWIDLDGTSVANTTHARAGSQTLKYTLTASDTASGYTALNTELGVLKSDAVFSFAYYISNISALDLKFMVDSSNYYHYTGWSLTNGYHIGKVLKSDFVAVGTPDWSTVVTLQIDTTATGSPGALELDALRYDSAGEATMLTRVVVSPPIKKLIGKTLDIEYVFDLGFA